MAEDLSEEEALAAVIDIANQSYNELSAAEQQKISINSPFYKIG